MRIAVIYAEQPPDALLRVFEECGLKPKLMNYAEAETQLQGDRLYDAVFCELHMETLPRPLLTEIAALDRKTLRFSFSAENNSPLRERSAALGFISQIETTATAAELSLHLQYSRRISSEQTALSRVERTLSAVNALHFSLDTSNVIESALEYLPGLIQADSWAIFVNSEDGERLDLVGELNAPPSPPLSFADDEGRSSLIRAALSGKPILLDDLKENPSDDPRYSDGECRSVMCLPLSTHARLFGVLEAIIRKNGRRFDSADLEIAEHLAISLSSALANAASFSSAERLGQTDDLTKLYNSRFLHQALEAEVRRARRYKIPMSLVFLDLDGFKSVNDTNGHLCGSATLTEVANLMMGLVRETDIVARYGGDEFVIVLPETPAERAVTIAERIRKQIEAHVFRGGGESEIYLTASFGVASYPEHASSPAALIRCADRAMYMAKETNKNQVILAT